MFEPGIRNAIKREKRFTEDISKIKNELGTNVGLLVEKMIKEKNAILSMALEQLKVLKSNNFKFFEPDAMADARLQYEKDNNTLLSFVEECCYVGDDIPPNLRIRRSQFKEAYNEYIKQNKNGRGKVQSSDMNILLKQYYKENYIKSNGSFYMEKITLLPEFQEELNIFIMDNFKRCTLEAFLQNKEEEKGQKLNELLKLNEINFNEFE